jgi:hypothetical protein
MIRPVKPSHRRHESAVKTSFGASVATRSVFAAATVSLIALGSACTDDEDNGTDNTSSGTTNPTTTTGGTGGTGGGTGGDAGFNFGGNAQGGSGGSCAHDDIQPLIESLPSDIIFVIDNSGSMSDEIAQVEANITNNFASIIGASGIDYQVIMVTNHGTGSYDVCITGTLSGATDCSMPPGDTATFHHYDLDVQSLDSMCLILDTFYGSNNGGEADQYGLHPEGWSKWLRPEAVKVFVEITDDGISCSWNNQGFNVTFNDSDSVPGGQTTATLFDNTLLSLSPLHFGTTLERKYMFYSIVGMIAKAAAPDAPYESFEPVQTANCSCPNSPMPPAGCPISQSTTAYSPGTGYQWLSRGTDALRFPVCNTASYDAVFQDIAAGVINATSVPCEFDLPPPSNGQTPDLMSLQVLYTHGDMTTTEEFNRVASEAACGVLDNAFWLDESTDPDRVHLCPNACDKVEDDELAALTVRYECGGIE